MHYPEENPGQKKTPVAAQRPDAVEATGFPLSRAPLPETRMVQKVVCITYPDISRADSVPTPSGASENVLPSLYTYRGNVVKPCFYRGFPHFLRARAPGFGTKAERGGANAEAPAALLKQVPQFLSLSFAQSISCFKNTTATTPTIREVFP